MNKGWQRLLLAVALIGALPLTGCTTPTGTKAGTSKPAPPLASVTPLADPRSHEGPSTAVIKDAGIHPVTAGEPALPATVVDAQGTRVQVTDTSRVLALDIYGTLSRTVFELGQGERLVGRDLSTQFDPAKKLPLVTPGGHDLNAEAILGLDPTLIITDTSLGPWDVILQMRDAGIPVVVTESARNLDNIDTITTQVATALGVPQAGAELNERISAELDEVRTQIKKVAPTAISDQLRTVFIYARGKSGVYYLFGEGSGADSLITSLGLYDVAAEIDWKGSKPLTDEGIIAAQPDVILMMTQGLSSAGGVDGLLKRFPALANTPAGQNRRIVDMDDSAILGYGPLTPAVLNALAVAIYAPDAIGGN
ncbi:MAG TPA: ABC transporter substrate-binding protein [Marmoricola sp.]|nr:ABC transporter substrate-binding protein [Marmoricola sp.]HNI69911.1 ABC transporter substrate-binding protein [Marmoricola sp.]HNJ78359.1 ABC transporter substrate-binding protein [Marmoricola sp.]